VAAQLPRRHGRGRRRRRRRADRGDRLARRRAAGDAGGGRDRRLAHAGGLERGLPGDRAAIAIAQRRIGALPWWGALAFPLGVAAFVGVSALAAWDRARGAPVRWRGRSVAVGGPR
jgi:hypothetical protein